VVKNTASYFEIEVGKMTFGELLNDLCGGPKEGQSFKAVIPGGSSSKILRCNETFTIGKGDDAKEMSFFDLPLDFDTLAAAGSMAGSGGVMVLDETRKISWVLDNITKFYAHESCGQCTPCREGSTWMKKIAERIHQGKATPKDLETLESVAYQIDGKTVCAFGEACSWPVEAMIDKYREELLGETSEDNSFKSPEQEEREKFLQMSV